MYTAVPNHKCQRSRDSADELLFFAQGQELVFLGSTRVYLVLRKQEKTHTATQKKLPDSTSQLYTDKLYIFKYILHAVSYQGTYSQSARFTCWHYPPYLNLMTSEGTGFKRLHTTAFKDVLKGAMTLWSRDTKQVRCHILNDAQTTMSDDVNCVQMLVHIFLALYLWGKTIIQVVQYSSHY